MVVFNVFVPVRGSPAFLRNEAGHGDLRTSALDVRSARFAGSSSARVHPHLSSWTPAAYEAEELAYPDIEYEFFDSGALSCVRRWMPSWAGFAHWYIVPDRGWYRAFTEAQWGLLSWDQHDDGGGGVARETEPGGIMRQSTRLLEEFWSACSRGSHLGIWSLISSRPCF